MSAQIPDVNVIRDTPTSPNHRPLQVYTSPTSTPEADSPEVDPRSREAEGLQVNPNGPYPEPTTDSGVIHKWWQFAGSSEKQVLHYDRAGLIPVEKGNMEDRGICGLKRRTFIIIAAVVAIIVMCAAVGGGVGGYYANRPSSTSSGAPTPTPTSSPITSAASPCVSTIPSQPGAPHATPTDANPYLATGATFNITCRRGVPGSGDRQGRPIKDLKRFVTSNISSCMDLCAQARQCGGVIYGANLEKMVDDGTPGANCVLKNNAWEPTSLREEWFASAVKM